jgi:glutamate---cysteine ligase / carboxylate-amine ligase
VRIMDSQTRVEDTAAIAALVQCLVRLEAEREPVAMDPPEVLAENRFIAARDGMDARLIEPATGGRRPVRERLRELLDECQPHARALGCLAELSLVAALAESPGAERQRAMAERAGGLEGLVAALSATFT